MDTAHRRMEIISILSVKRHITSRELAWELGVTMCTLLCARYTMIFSYCLLIIQFIQNRVVAAGFSLQKITSPIPLVLHLFFIIINKGFPINRAAFHFFAKKSTVEKLL